MTIDLNVGGEWCPKCGRGVMEYKCLLDTYPATYEYKCSNCEHREYRTKQ